MYTLLIVDDEYPARQLMRMMVDGMPDFSVAAEAENGKKALELYHQLRPDIILTDIEMPVMNGLDLIEAVKAENPEQPIIILSCYESFVFAQRAMRSGVRSYLIKDMTEPAELERCLRAAASALPQREPPSVAEEELDTFDKLRRVNPIGAKQLEPVLDRLFTAFFKHEADNCVQEVRRLYQFNVTGMLQFRFLEYINITLVRWIAGEMTQFIIPPTALYGEMQTPESQLDACASPADMCDLVCGWIAGWMRLAEERHLVSLRTKKILWHIADHYAEDITLEDTAKRLYVHPVHVSRAFKYETGINFTEALNRVRIEKAKLLLALGSQKVNEVAFAVGFKSPQGFYSAFKKHTGLSPADYSRNV